jgi:glycyl-tRNA synthetase
MAHYAKECWDAEALTSFDWLEIIGIANRSAFDLKAHITATGQELSAFIPYDEPMEREVETIVVDMKALGPMFRSNAGKVKTAMEALAIDQLKGKKTVSVSVDGEDIEIPNSCFSIQTKKEKLSGQRIIPNVLEPSFGIDRIFYTLLEHSYKELEPPADIAAEDVDDQERNASNKYRVLTFLPKIAPIKVGVFPLMPKDGLVEISSQINEDLKKNNVKTYYDESGSIGRRYARMDEIGTPYCLTVDYQTKTDQAVTIRDRDTHDQVRVKIDELVGIIQDLIVGSLRLDQLPK